jgi:choline dehydrogenase-like flavoprotein
VIEDARGLPDAHTLGCDVCVVGAGAVGIALARALAGSKLRVCLLESGGMQADPATQALYAGRVFGRAYFPLDECRTRRFGGSTHCWLGVCRPLVPADLEARDWVPHSGWPFGFEVLAPWYERAHEVCRLEDFDYRGERWGSPERPALPLGADVETRVFQLAPNRFDTLYREELARARNLEAYLFANAVELEVDESAQRVTALRAATLAGRSFRVRARRFVLAAGGIENARLLLASRARRPEGLGNAHGLVGRYFMEHPHVVCGAFLPSRADLDLGLYLAHAAGRVSVQGHLAATEAARRRLRMLDFAAFLGESAELPEFERALAPVIRELDGQGASPAERAIFLVAQCEQAPNEHSRVRLGDDADALGVPRVQLEWRLGAQDKRSARLAGELLARALGAAGLGRLQLLLSDDDHVWPEELSGGRHHMGTTRMHDDPRQGVVDAHCRVHGLLNLHVAGSSVFPTAGAASPTLTAVALALRLADHLARELA